MRIQLPPVYGLQVRTCNIHGFHYTERKIMVGRIRLVRQISDGICKVSTHRTLGISQVVKAQDFDSCNRWFESNIPSHMDAYLSRLEGWSYKPVVLSSILRASTIYQMKRRITSVSNGSC